MVHRVVLLAPARARAAQALVRWDPFGHAERELEDRTLAGLPPAIRLAAVQGDSAAVADLVAAATLPPSADVLGPVDVADGSTRALVRSSHAEGLGLASALHAAQAVRSARKATGVVRVELDPLELA